MKRKVRTLEPAPGISADSGRRPTRRHLVWHAPGVAKPLLAQLPKDLEARPFPSGIWPDAAGDELGVLLVDLTAGDSSIETLAAAHRLGIPTVALDTPGRAPAGEVWCSYAYLTQPVDPAALAMTLRNACEQAGLRREAEDTRRQLEELNAISVRLSAERDPDTLLALILTKARQITRSDAGSIYLVEELPTGSRQLRFMLAQNDTMAVPFAEFTLPINHASVAGYAVLSRQTLTVDDAYALPTESPFQVNLEFDAQTGYRTKSMLVVPMHTPSGDTIGVLQLINGKRTMEAGFTSCDAIAHEAVSFPARFQDLAAAFASHAAVAIRNAQLVAELTKRQRRLEALVELSRQVSRLEPLTPLLQRIAEACGRLFGSDSVGFRLVEGDELVVTATWGDASDVLLTGRLKLGESLSGRVAATGEVLTVTDLTTDPRVIPAHRDALIASGYRALLAVPVKVGDRVIGVLSIRLRHEQGISPEDVALATAFASQAAIALENSRLYGELGTALAQLEGSQQQLIQVERLRALGEMAAGVAHDFNNLLAVILGRTQMLLTQVQEPAHLKSLESVHQAALDGAQTVRRIQEFTRTRRTRPFGRVQLRELLEEVVEFTTGRWKDDAQGRGIAYEVCVEGEAESPVAGIAEELREVFMNLLINALDAMPTGGRVTFGLSADTEWVTVAVTDTGCGMSEDTRRRVLEPFFTTKGTRGTGLGLAVSWGIIKRHGGTIGIRSILGEGSTFTIRLPIGPSQAAEDPPASTRSLSRPARVLVIDDEPAVRAVLKDLLASGGHIVFEAGDGVEGLKRCETDAVDLIMTDLSMPGMSGWDVAAACRTQFPHIPVGFATGWGDQLDPEQLGRDAVRFVLTKPFVAAAVLDAVAGVLGGQRDSHVVDHELRTPSCERTP